MTVNQLLRQVRKAVEEDEKIKNAQKKSGAQFNVFTALGVETKENYHSAFIAELLNPKGSHGQGNKFLQSFLDIVEFNRQEFKEDANVKAENDIGKTNEEKTEGGRLDVLIKSASEKFAVIIENKIYAADGEKQLFRYKNYLEGKKSRDVHGLGLKSGSYRLFYLTLYGKDPEDYSTGEYNKEYWNNISYEYHIRRWLDECLEIVGKIKSDNQNLKNSIVQYKQVVDELTEHAEKNTPQRIKELVEENLVIAEESEKSLVENGEEDSVEYNVLVDCINSVKKDIIKNCLFPKLEGIAKKYDLVLAQSKKDLSDKLNRQYEWFTFYKEKQRKVEDRIYIAFCFREVNYQKLWYGIWDGGDRNPKLRNAIEKLLEKEKRYDKNSKWLCYKKMMDKENRNWNANAFIMLKDEDKSKEFMKPIEKRLKEILDYLKKNNLERYF